MACPFLQRFYFHFCDHLLPVILIFFQISMAWKSPTHPVWVSYRCFEFLPQPSYMLVRWSWRERSWRGPLFWCGFIINYNDMQRIKSIPSLMFVLLPSKFMLLTCEKKTMRRCPLFVSNLLITFIQLLNSFIHRFALYFFGFGGLTSPINRASELQCRFFVLSHSDYL